MTYKPFTRPNKVLEALAKGETPLGMQMYTHSEDLIEIVGFTGFDFVMIDMEHSRVNLETMVHCIRAAEVSGLTPMVRVIENSPSHIRSAIEAGAQGIFVPHIKNAEDAQKALEAMRYPPEGKCGICPSIRASGYSQDYWEEYMETANNQVMFIPLLEDVEAIEKAEEIFALLKPGRDAVGLGLGDITNSLLTKPGEKVQGNTPTSRKPRPKSWDSPRKPESRSSAWHGPKPIWPVLKLSWPGAPRFYSSSPTLISGTSYAAILSKK